jgi:shikimate kinase
VARLLAQRLGWSWADADAVLETRFSRTIQQIFADEGETGFRAKEAEVLLELCNRQGHVIATGGGVVLAAENRQRLKEAGTVVWLKADAHTLHQRLQQDVASAERRPALTVGGLAEVEQLLRVREPLYAEVADHTVETVGRPPTQVAEEILAALPKLS